ncbi:MAG TPA: hypothetical protein VGN17_28410 [Bryobacteraceae bacterium]|jgi:DNA-binding XRE family transcriptional regulator
MPNLSNVFKDQMARIANRQINRQGKVVRKLLAQHRRDLAALKRQIAQLTRAVGFLGKQERRRVGSSPGVVAAASTGVGAAGDRLRFRADGLKTHRAKLGLSAADYGKLVGVSGLTIYNWEAKKAKPQKAQVAKVATVRGLGKREAVQRLEQMK